MRKTAMMLALVLASVLPCAAQNDSTVFANGPWNETEVSRGITLRHCQFADSSLFGANEYVSVLIISRRYALDVVTAADSTLAKTTELADKYGATVAVNGSYFRMKAPYGSVTYVKVDGRQVGANSLSANSPERSDRIGGSVAFKGRRARMYKVDSEDREWEDCIPAEDVLCAGPLMILQGRDEYVARTSFNTTRHPRTAVGMRRDGSRVLVVVDGRNAMSAGVSISELQQIMRWLGCVDALNLDGGGSSTMVVNGEIINHPCDNGRFDAAGERSVSNAIICQPRRKGPEAVRRSAVR